jgi:hypothetical protein
LGIPLAQLKLSRITFHGIVLGHSCTPLGRVQLEVLFGNKGNSRREPIWFEVVAVPTMRCLAVQPWPSSWQCHITPIQR